MAKRIFPEGKDASGRPYDDLRWSRFENFAPAEMLTVVGERVFPFLRNMGGDGSTYSLHMKDDRFTIPTPGLLANVVDVCYSWGMYEIVCLITVLTTCRAIASKEPQYTASSWVTSERCYEFEVGADHRLQVHFQAKFPSIAPPEKQGVLEHLPGTVPGHPFA